jgi:diguanylate cyclase (GGDEF)-like protein
VVELASPTVAVATDATRLGAALGRLPARAVVAVLSVETVAAMLVLGSISVPTTGELTLAAFLTLLSLVHTELATGVERIRRRDAENTYFDLSSVWTFAAALLLPMMLAAGVIIVVYVHLWWRVWRPANVPVYRHLYTTATVVLAAAAAHAVVRGAGGMPTEAGDVVGMAGIGLAVVIYVAVNTLLVAGAIALSDDREGEDRTTARDLIGRWDDNALEVATICMGALAAVALSSAPGLVALVLPPIVVLHRAVLVRQLEEVASTDAKTGLLNAAAWRTQAMRAVSQAQRDQKSSVAVLILDLDHFKTVNDRYGHLTGDDVLVAVAAELRAGSRAHDAVGRFGGEEFVVLLRDLPAGPEGSAVLHSVAERIRCRVAGLEVRVDNPGCSAIVGGLSASIGGAVVPTDGGTLDEVLKVADASLYAAKRDGRDRVRIASGPEVPAARLPVP